MIFMNGTHFATNNSHQKTVRMCAKTRVNSRIYTTIKSTEKFTVFQSLILKNCCKPYRIKKKQAWIKANDLLCRVFWWVREVLWSMECDLDRMMALIGFCIYDIWIAKNESHTRIVERNKFALFPFCTIQIFGDSL